MYKSFDRDPLGTRTREVRTDSTSLDWSEVLTCSKCGQTARRRVRSSASAMGESWGANAAADAKYEAGITAFERAQAKGQSMVRQVRCRGCGHRESDGWASGASVAVVLGAAVVVGAYFLGHLGLGLVVGVVLAGVLVPVLRSSSLASADASVSFESLEPPPQAFVPEPVAPSPERAAAQGKAGEFELDLDRKWNKR